MKMKSDIVGYATRMPVILLIALMIGVAGGEVVSQEKQKTFATPDEAVKALEAATKNKDRGALLAIFGEGIKDLVSGDQQADQNAYDQFAASLEDGSKLEKVDENTFNILIGEDGWPFAVPIIKDGTAWRFDTGTGVEEVINRRVGANEFDAMMLCQIYAVAQREYFDGGDWDGDQVAEYAQKIASTPGMKDGLFWNPLSEDDDESPLGPVFAAAAAEGYETKDGTTESAPFHGYRFKMLFGQGASAPGGKYGYVINGNMIGGYALVAYPATWGSSGVMTFMINQEGRVYQKDLGPDTTKIADGMTEYDPDPSWSLAYIN
jgi:hypothetical protein